MKKRIPFKPFRFQKLLDDFRKYLSSFENSDREAGWSFVETLVVIAIVLILTTSVGIAVVGNIGKAKEVSARDNIQSFATALDLYLLDVGRYPTAEQGLNALWEKPILEPFPDGWNGPYIKKKIPQDPWNNEFDYSSPGPNGLPFGIRSFGADGTEGGEGDNKDITSWED